MACLGAEYLCHGVTLRPDKQSKVLGFVWVLLGVNMRWLISANEGARYQNRKQAMWCFTIGIKRRSIFALSAATVIVVSRYSTVRSTLTDLQAETTSNINAYFFTTLS